MRHLSIISAVAAFFLLVVFAWQRNEIAKLKLGNSEISIKMTEYQNANMALIAEYSAIRQELENAAKRKETAEAESQAFRKRLSSAQSGASCVAVAVPPDVIRMQREAITATNKKFSMPNL